jgi:hypothetical protein
VHSENVTLLQEFMEIFNLVNGERGALLKLSFALYKEQKFPQAKRVLNVPGMRCDNEKAFNFCQKLLEENNFLALDKFCEDANCLFGISKEDLIHYKVLGLVESGQQSVALDYYNQLVNQDILLERKTTEIFARLYQVDSRISQMMYGVAISVPPCFTPSGRLPSTPSQPTAVQAVHLHCAGS